MKATIVIGRFNPPTIGHEKLLMKAKDVADSTNSTLMIFPTQSFDNDKNPLSFSDKLEFMKLSFPSVAENIIDSETMGIKHVYGVVDLLNEEGYTSVNLIVGGDRTEDFVTVQKYLDGELNIISAGNRTEDDEVSAMSASKMREFVRTGNIDGFITGTTNSLNNNDAKTMFNLIGDRINYYGRE